MHTVTAWVGWVRLYGLMKWVVRICQVTKDGVRKERYLDVFHHFQVLLPVGTAH